MAVNDEQKRYEDGGQYSERQQAPGETGEEIKEKNHSGEKVTGEDLPVSENHEAVNEPKEGGPVEKAEAKEKHVEEENNGRAEIERLKKELEEQKARAGEYYNRLVRLQADFENFRRRTTREREEFVQYATASLCEALLPVLDNFQLALEAKDQDPAKVVEGVEMIYRQLLDVLQKEGLTPIEAEGQQFDPTKHEAAMRELTSEYPDNTVIAELRRGYFLKDKLLRPAMVKVAKSE